MCVSLSLSLSLANVHIHIHRCMRFFLPILSSGRYNSTSIGQFIEIKLPAAVIFGHISRAAPPRELDHRCRAITKILSASQFDAYSPAGFFPSAARTRRSRACYFGNTNWARTGAEIEDELADVCERTDQLDGEKWIFVGVFNIVIPRWG